MNLENLLYMVLVLGRIKFRKISINQSSILGPDWGHYISLVDNTSESMLYL